MKEGRKGGREGRNEGRKEGRQLKYPIISTCQKKKKIIPHCLRSTRYASGCTRYASQLKNWEYHGEQNRHGFSIQGAYTYM